MKATKEKYYILENTLRALTPYAAMWVREYVRQHRYSWETGRELVACINDDPDLPRVRWNSQLRDEVVWQVPQNALAYFEYGNEGADAFEEASEYEALSDKIYDAGFNPTIWNDIDVDPDWDGTVRVVFERRRPRPDRAD